jgi:hypothetical protein
MGLQRSSLFDSFSFHHGGAQHQVRQNHRFLRVVEGQHIGRIVLGPEVPVEGLSLLRIHDAHCELSGSLQGSAKATPNETARKGGPVATTGLLKAEAQILVGDRHLRPSLAS